MPAFTSNVIENINYIVCPADIDKDGVAQFEIHIKRWSELGIAAHVFDFRAVKKIHPTFLQTLAKFRTELLKKNSKVVSVNMSQAIVDQVTRAGLDKAVGYMKEIGGKTATKSKLAPGEVRKSLIRGLVEAAYQAMNIMFDSTLAADENFTQNPKEFSFDDYECASVINVDNAFLKASFRLYFPQNTVKSLSHGLTGIELNQLDKETVDSTATELLNIIYGRAKSKLNDEKDFNLPPAIPILRRGPQMRDIRRSDPKQIVFLPLASPFGSFFLEVDFG